VEIEVIRSARRKKTVEAHMVDGRMRLSIPARLSKAEERHWIEVMEKRLAPKIAAADIDLPARAARLAQQCALPAPRTIRFVGNQEQRWGSCTPDDGAIRISSKLAKYPSWVLDYVIVHELAHLEELHHNERFHALVNRYPRSERARGFLIAKGLPDDDDDALTGVDAAAAGTELFGDVV
jgi:predicted metal-dependent hydrolase